MRENSDETTFPHDNIQNICCQQCDIKLGSWLHDCAVKYLQQSTVDLKNRFYIYIFTQLLLMFVLLLMVSYIILCFKQKLDFVFTGKIYSLFV